MKRTIIGLSLLVGLGLISCESKKKNDKQAETVNEVAKIEEAIIMKSGPYSFKITEKNDSIYIVPSGLTENNDTVKHSMMGWSQAGVEIADLNEDGYPELFIFLTSDGSGSYGELIGYSVNNGKSMSQVYLAPISENEKMAKGYMGHDKFRVVGKRLLRSFPIYKPDDTNAKPTGGKRTVTYKLSDGEAQRVLDVESIAISANE